MAHIRKESVTVTFTTATLTGASEYTPVLNGIIKSVVYSKPASSVYSTSAGLHITGEVSGISILHIPMIGDASFTKFPHGSAVNTTNGAITNSFAHIPICEERVKVTVGDTAGGASTGADLTGTFYIYVDGN